MSNGRKKKELPKTPFGFFEVPDIHFSLGIIFAAAVFLSACSFDYGQAGEADKSRPDIIMENLEYVRVRGGDPQVRFRAEHAERWEERHTMELSSFTFEQMEDQGETVNAEGRAGAAVVQLDSGDISLSGGVRIRVDSEDVIIRTGSLEWKDKAKTLTGGPDDEVDIERSDGTSFSGRGFLADARNRTWSFDGEVKGLYVEKEDEEESPDGSEDRLPVETGWADALVPSTVPQSGEGVPVPGQLSSPEQLPPPEQLPSPEQVSSPERVSSPPAPDQFFEPKPSLPQADNDIPWMLEEK